MKELEIAIKQLENAYKNLEKAEEKMFYAHYDNYSSTLNKIMKEISHIKSSVVIVKASHEVDETKYKIINAEGCEIAYLTVKEFEEYQKNGLINWNDKVIEVKGE